MVKAEHTGDAAVQTIVDLGRAYDLLEERLLPKH